MKMLFPVLLLTLVACAKNDASMPPETTAPSAATATEGAPGTDATTTTVAPSAEVPQVLGPKLLPVDEGAGDPSFAKYREELLAEVRSRNTEAVAARVDPNIRTTFGDGGGLDDFRKVLAQPGRWESLERALTLGGRFVGEGETRSFWAPYVYSAWPDRHDAFESLVVTGENVPLRESAADDGRVVATLTHDIVTRVEPGADLAAPFVQVKTADGLTGFVSTSAVLSPVGYRAGFMKKDGEWRMNAFVAGD
jgi:hypothetical protein